MKLVITITILIYIEISNYIIKSEVIFQETFLDDTFTERWTESTYRGIDQGKFQLSAGKYFGDFWTQRGLQTTENKKYYGISTKFDTPFTNRETNLVLQYQVKFERFVECGGGYIKLLGSDFEPLNFSGKTPYKIMFGPDMCGDDISKVHVLLNYKDKYYNIKKNIRCKTDRFSHLYTLIIRPNSTYQVLIDNKHVEGGNIEDDFVMLKPKRIKDPNATKPEDWVTEEFIDDPSQKKPDDWDQPMTISDPNATKPDYWDEDVDGIWEPPKIENPEYKGEWKPEKITNPKFKGEWTPPEIDNPDYEPDPYLYVQDDIGGVGFELWQVKSGSIFDNILVSDSPEEAEKIGEQLWTETIEDEKQAYNMEQEQLRLEKEELKRLDEERKKEEAEAEEKEDAIEDESKSPEPETGEREDL